ncbi:hypothetical protein BH23ACT5_BH23ACT5_08600 [soil metagenome]
MRATPLLVGLTLLTLAACDASSSPSTTEIPLSTTTTETVTTSGPPPTAPSFAPVRVDLSADGRYLVDAGGKAVYMFTLDDQRISTCEGACAEVWPPLMGTPEAGPGVDESHLGNAERRGGGIQVTYAGQPLYHYAEDSVGETTGHGFNDFWFLVDPAGGPLND